MRGRVPAFPRGSGSAAGLIAHVAADLQRRECRVRVEGERIVLESGAPGRYSPLAFVDGGTIELAVENGKAVLRYDLSTGGGLALCLVLAPVLAAVAWFTLGDPALTVFAFVMPVAWLYGANYLTACVRVPRLLGRLCETALVPEPGWPGQGT